MLKKPTHNSGVGAPEGRADDPELAMQQFTDGLRRVMAALKQTKNPRTQTHHIIL